eukprot:scaffold1376_cov125-Cylindrotheca_fusiformis.AAC.4
MPEKEKVCPAALAKLLRTATVLKGWTTAQPMHPPNPDVAKMTLFGMVLVVAGAAGAVARMLLFCGVVVNLGNIVVVVVVVWYRNSGIQGKT